MTNSERARLLTLLPLIAMLLRETPVVQVARVHGLAYIWAVMQDAWLRYVCPYTYGHAIRKDATVSPQ